MGKLMSAVRPKVVDRADENLVSQIVKEYLNSKYKKRTQCKLSSFFLFLWFSLKLNHKVQWLRGDDMREYLKKGRSYGKEV